LTTGDGGGAAGAGCGFETPEFVIVCFGMITGGSGFTRVGGRIVLN
jgi:hypothetical protein